MKKILLCVLVSCLTALSYAQEVRGCTTRRVIYEGGQYYCNGSYENQYYGWEITNHNSFSVSVDLMLTAQGGVWSNGYNTVEQKPRIVKTQSIILKPNESYIFKREEHTSTRVKCGNSEYPISSYSFDYKAYKM